MSIFQRLPFLGDTAEKENVVTEKAVPAEPALATVPFDTFASVELRVGTVVSAEPVEGSEKLLRLTVDFGEDEPRQVVSGIAKHVDPLGLPGRQFAFVANLPPRPIMGLESRAMILAADGDGGLALLAPTRPVPPGERLH